MYFLGNVPGILIYGPSQGRSGVAYQMGVTKKLYPFWDDLPLLRHHAGYSELKNFDSFQIYVTDSIS